MAKIGIHLHCRRLDRLQSEIKPCILSLNKINENLEKFFTKKIDAEILRSLYELPVNKHNVRKFAAKIRTLEVGRLLNIRDFDVNRIFSGQLSYSKAGYFLHMLNC